MVITHKLVMNLEGKERTPWIEVSQWDAYTRRIALRLFEGKRAWTIPDDVALVLHYQKPDGTKGAYDTLPNGERAWQVQENVLMLTLAPQVLTAAGMVMLQATLFREEAVLTTCIVEICVRAADKEHETDGASENYLMVTGVLPAPETAQAGNFLRVKEVNAAGKVTGVEAVDLPEADIDEAQVREIVEAYCQENPPAGGGEISWDDLGEKDVVFFEGNNVAFTDDGATFESNGIPVAGDMVTVEFDGVSGVYEVLDMFGTLSIEAPGVVILYMDGIAMAFADDTSTPHNIKMTGKIVTKMPDRYAAEPCTKFYIDQSGKTYLSSDILGEHPVTREDLLAAIIRKPVIVSLGDSEFYTPVVVNPYDGDRAYGSVTIMKADGTRETYYTSEYNAS